MDNSAFFELLRAGLWENYNIEECQHIDWTEVYTLSKNQAVIALVYDGLIKLPKSKRPINDLFLKWTAIVLRIEKQNAILNQRVDELFDLYYSNGIKKALLLKGQGISRYYPNPAHRMPGDIDVYITEEYFNDANKLLVGSSGILDHETLLHSSFIWKGVLIENHKHTLIYNYKNYSMKYKDLTSNIWANKQQITTFLSNKVHIPPILFDAVYLIGHIQKHIFTQGVGLRQPIDWLLLLHNNKDYLLKESLEQHLKQLGLLELAQAVVVIGTKYLGFSSRNLPISLPHSESNANKLLQDILNVGNFGINDKHLKNRPSSFWSGKFFSFVIMTKRLVIMRNFFPKEICFIPVFKIKNVIYLVYKDYLSKLKKLI